jgi:hypothetical protein
MDAQLRAAMRDPNTDPMETLARLARAGVDLTIDGMRTIVLKPTWQKRIRLVAMDLRVVRNDEIFPAPAFNAYSIQTWNADTYCTCEESGCDCCEENPQGDECCGACFMVHCGDCHGEITDWVYTMPAYGEWYCEACAFHGLTYQEWSDPIHG